MPSEAGELSRQIKSRNKWLWSANTFLFQWISQTNKYAGINRDVFLVAKIFNFKQNTLFIFIFYLIRNWNLKIAKFILLMELRCNEVWFNKFRFREDEINIIEVFIEIHYEFLIEILIEILLQFFNTRDIVHCLSINFQNTKKLALINKFSVKWDSFRWLLTRCDWNGIDNKSDNGNDNEIDNVNDKRTDRIAFKSAILVKFEFESVVH